MNYQLGQAAYPMSKPMSNNAGYQCGHPGMYGSSGPSNDGPTMKQQSSPFLRGQRSRLNIVAILLSLFVPWLLFCMMCWTMSFEMHYNRVYLCHFIVFLGFCIMAGIGIFAFQAIQKKKEATGASQFWAGGAAGRATYHEPTWLIFMFLTCLLAWVLGVVAGDCNFYNNLEPYYDVTNMNTYQDVDPSRSRGQQLMDGGRVMFSQNTTLDLTRSMGFKNSQMYCVAPIVGGKDPKHISSYDFWAVGMNCCSGTSADFHCGEFNNARAGAGLRLMRDDQRAFYRLAVQQAEAAYNIRANHPLFYYWMHDPVTEVNSYQADGYKYFFILICSHFMVQLFLVLICCMLFSKLATFA